MKKVIFLSTVIAFSFLECAGSQPYLHDEDRHSSGMPNMAPEQAKPTYPKKLHTSTLLKSPQQRDMYRLYPRKHRMDTPMSGKQNRR